MRRYIFKTIKTPKGFYIYDRSYNRIFRVNKEEFEELLKVEKNIISEANSSVIQKYAKSKVLGENQLQEIEHPETKLLKHIADCRLEHLVLQVTQQCNLRCAYCVYSGNYDTRGHSDKKMSWETARKAIDYIISHSSELQEICFGFYGGEPLLEFELIKKCVNYVQANMEGRSYRFSMTTNGTLLRAEVVKFLAEHKFQLSISLDGSKKEHDANRCFRNGTGTFDVIERNILYIKENYEEFWKEIQFLITLNTKSDLDHIITFFESSNMLPHKLIQFNEVSEVGLKNDALRKYNQNYQFSKRFRYIKALWALVEQSDAEQEDFFVKRIAFDKKRFVEEMKRGGTIACKGHHGGPCVPGGKRIFVSTDGVFFPCEKVNESLPGMTIGSVDSGLDLEKMSQILNIGKVTKEKCLECTAFRDCKICAGRINGDENSSFVTANTKTAACGETLGTFISSLYEYCVMEECKAAREVKHS